MSCHVVSFRHEAAVTLRNIVLSCGRKWKCTRCLRKTLAETTQMHAITVDTRCTTTRLVKDAFDWIGRLMSAFDVLLARSSAETRKQYSRIS